MFNFTSYDAYKFLSLKSQVIFGYTDILVFRVTVSSGMVDHSLTHGAEPFLRSCQLCSHSRTSQH
jgi:hypothetical protein